VLVWPPNSPDLNPIEPSWRGIKFSWKKQRVPKSRPALEKDWSTQWRDYLQEKLRRLVERIPGNVRWVIRLAGGN
ncbi:hypothetical protein B0T26DRAFT_627224, partial [Lasiosphaeria miniovina]